MKKITILSFLLVCKVSKAGAVNIGKLDKCNVVWNVQSDNAEGFMPIVGIQRRLYRNS